MIKVRAIQSFAGSISMRIGEERVVDDTKNIRELIKCGHLELLEDLSEDYKGIEIDNMSKKQLVRYAKDNRIPIAEEAADEIILGQVKAFLDAGKKEQEKSEQEKQEKSEQEKQKRLKESKAVKNETERNNDQLHQELFKD